MSSEVKVDIEPVARVIERLGRKIDDLNSNISDLKIKIVAMQTAIVGQIIDLKNTVLHIEKQKLRAKTSTSEDFLARIDDDLKEFEERLVAEMDKLRSDYSSEVDRVANHLMEEIEVNVEPLHEVFNQLEDVINRYVDPTLDVCGDLKAAYTSVYENRLRDIEETRQRITKNFEDFIQSRENLVQQIESMQVSGIPTRENATIYIPFWFIGIKDSDGKENVRLLPILEKFVPQVAASAKQPYVEHLRPPLEFAFEELTKELVSEGNIELARKVSIAVTPDKEAMRRALEKMRQDSTIHESFFEAISKFREVY